MAKKTGLQKKLRLVKVPTMVYLEPEQAAQLRQLRDGTGRPMQSFMREGVDLVLAKYRKRRK